MSIKKYDGEQFTDISSRQRCDGTNWVELTVGKRYDGTDWIDLWSSEDYHEEQTYVKTYSLASSANYWGSGSKDGQYPDLLIQGSYGGTLATTRRAMMIFDYRKIAEDLKGAEVLSVRLKLQRSNTAHGLSGASSIYIKTHNNASLPSTWKGADSGNADNGTPTISRGESKWLSLNKSLAEKLCNGEIKGLVLDADTDYSLAAYVKFNKSATRLEITYKK